MTRYHLIVCLPLLAAIVAGLFGRRIGDAAAMAVTCGAVIIGAVLSWVAFYLVIGHEQVVTVKVLDWIYSGGFQVEWALKIDQLTEVRLVVVNTVSDGGPVYSVGSMIHDPPRPRFFSQ